MRITFLHLTSFQQIAAPPIPDAKPGIFLYPITVVLQSLLIFVRAFPGLLFIPVNFVVQFSHEPLPERGIIPLGIIPYTGLNPSGWICLKKNKCLQDIPSCRYIGITQDFLEKTHDQFSPFVFPGIRSSVVPLLSNNRKDLYFRLSLAASIAASALV